jgi:hypothetical protein
MSHLPERAIEEFRLLWQVHFGEDLPPDTASLRAREVFAVLRLVLEGGSQQPPVRQNSVQETTGRTTDDPKRPPESKP